MKWFNNLKIGTKLTGGFVGIASMMMLLVIFNAIQLSNLGDIQDAGAKRSLQAINASETKEVALVLYQVIANAELNLDFKTSEQEWAAAKEHAVEHLNLLKENADTPLEETLANDAMTAYGKIVDTYEKKMLPILIAIKGTNNETRALDGEIDTYVAAMQTPINKYSASLVDENNQADKNFDDSRVTTVNTTQLAGIFSFLVAIILGITLSRSITGRLKRLTDASVRIAKGDLSQNVEITSKDELGQMAAAFSQMVGYLQGIANVANKVAANDLTDEVSPNSVNDVLGNAFKNMIGNLRAVLAQLSESSNQLNNASSQLANASTQAGQATNEIASTIQQVAKGIGSQSESISKTATSVEQMGRGIDGVTKGAQEQADAVWQGITNNIADYHRHTTGH